MSKHETWRTRQYWKQVGGMLIEEFLAVKGTKQQGKRLIDGIIVLGEETQVCKDKSYNLKGKDIIIIQTKANRLGMSLLGQTYFSQFLLIPFEPKSIKLVAICGQDDTVLRQVAQEHNIEVVIIPNQAQDR